MTATADKAVLTPEDAITWKYPRDPQISPDGDRVAFTLLDVAKPDEHKRSSIWMIDLPQKVARQFTFGPRSDKSPRWSSDGSRLAFVSDREEGGKFGLYAMHAGGGEATRLAEWKGDVSGPRWSPDSKTVAFIGADPKTEEEEKREKERRDEVVADTNFKFGRIYAVPFEGGEPRLLSAEGDTHVKAFNWAPDGSGVIAALVATPRADDVSYGPTELVFYPLREGEKSKSILHYGGLEEPQYSPDGKTIAFRATNGRINTDGAIWVVPASGGEPRCLTVEYEGLVDEIVWAPNSKEIRFVGYENLYGALRAVNVESGKLTYLLPEDQRKGGSFGGTLSFDGDGRCFTVVWSSSNQPPNVWVGEVGKQIERCTNLNEKLAGLPFSAAEEVSWQSSDGMTIYGLLHRPIGYQEGELYPLVVHIHGGPAWLWSDRFMGDWHDWSQPLAQRGYAVFLPNPRGSTGRGAAFTDAEINDIGGMELQDVLSGVDHVLGLGLVDPERMAIGGWSHGGYMTAWTITQTERFKCAIMGAGLSNLISDQGQSDIPRFNFQYFDGAMPYDAPDRYLARSAIAHLRNAKTPTLILHGEKDDRVALPQAHEMYRGLKWAGVETQFVTYPREPHGISEREHQRDLLERVLAWFEKYLGTGPSEQS